MSESGIGKYITSIYVIYMNPYRYKLYIYICMNIESHYKDFIRNNKRELNP